MLEDRRRHLLSDLASRAAGARNEEEVWRVSAETLGENCLSLPFAFLYEYRPSEHQAYLAGASVETDEALRPSVIDCRGENLWRFDPALAMDGVLVELGDLRFGRAQCRTGRSVRKKRAWCRSGWANTAKRWVSLSRESIPAEPLMMRTASSSVG